MSSVAIYVEGGGNGRDTKSALRQGMDSFLASLKDQARVKSWHWKLVCCGGRNAAYDAFQNALQSGDNTIVALLVDAEGPVVQDAVGHLLYRDGWDLTAAPADVVHLMVQTMEAWIVSDPDALAGYYKQGFQRNALPKHQNLEEIDKVNIASSLERATRRTQKGGYHKIRHAGDLLKLIDRQKVHQRCPSCERLFVALHQKIRGP